MEITTEGIVDIIIAINWFSIGESVLYLDIWTLSIIWGIHHTVCRMLESHPSKLAQVARLLTCIRAILGWNILWRVVPLRQQPYKFYFWHQPVTRPGVRDRYKRNSLEEVGFIGRHLYNYNYSHHNHWSCRSSCLAPLVALVLLSWSPAC
jgi:hypothetical protein